MDVLYERKNFLENQLNFYDDMVNVLVSFGISALSGLIISTENGVTSIIVIIELIVGVAFAIFARYAGKGHFDVVPYDEKYGTILEILKKYEKC